MEIDYKKKEKMCEYIIKKIINNMSGKGKEGEYCKFNKPSDLYSIGSLAPKPRKKPQNDEEEFFTEFLAKFAPHSMGLQFLGKVDAKTELQIKLSFSVYYRVIPTYDCQIELKESKSMVTVFKRKQIKNIKINLNLDEILQSKAKTYKLKDLPEVNRQLERVYEEILNDPMTFRTKEILITDEIIENEESYLKEIEKILHEDKICPEWDLELYVETREYESKKFLQTIITNTSNPELVYCKNYDSFLFDVRMEVSLEKGELYPFIFNLLEDSYRYDRKMWGAGINCVVDKDLDRNVLITNNCPVYKQARYGTRDYLPNGEKIEIAYFKKLIDNPIDVLEKIRGQMEDYKEYCLNNLDKIIENIGRREDDVDKLKKNLDEFSEEIKRFQVGINLLRKSQSQSSQYHIVYKAFKYMNEVFYEAGLKRKFESWRTFQIVFIVSNLIDIVEQHWVGHFNDNNIDKVSVLWFPTGGGKTEAYLGLVVFNLFFDRLRGKSDGVTALFKFPLRILSLQQFQRIFNIIMIANEIKNKYNIDGNLFSIGHWVGNNQTPNNIENISTEWKKDIEILKSGVESGTEWETVQQRLRRVKECPICNGEIVVIWNKIKNTIMHKCTNINCSFQTDTLPVYITDTDIYRYLPSIIVSTVDKIATAGMQAKFSNILGNVKYYNKEKGYLWSKCKLEDKEIIEIDEEKRKLLRPTLQIQDELHLIKEDLGAYNSHYETMIQRMQEKISGKYSWKIIASTATIQDYNRHISHLYGKEEKDKKSIRFPVEGPKSDESFYSVKDKNNSIGRYFVGVMGHNKTHINTTVDALYYFHKTIKELRKLDNEDFGKEIGISVNEDEKKDLLDEYEISLNYVLTKRNADQLAESINSQIEDYLRANHLSSVKNEMLTGGTTPDQLANVLRKVEKEYKTMEIKDRITSITATSMISHGVDVDRFNFMLFFGMPRQTSEYIQASSRVGRTHPGITILVFAPQRERDQSYFKYFYKYHQYLDRLVEIPAINRWSKFSIEKTYPGLLLGYIYFNLNRDYGEHFYFTDNLNYKFYKKLRKTEREKIKDEIIEELRRYYVSSLEKGDWFNNTIEQNTETFFESLTRYRTNNMQNHLMNTFGHAPMRSLRDTEEEVPFYETDELHKVKKDIEF